MRSKSILVVTVVISFAVTPSAFAGSIVTWGHSDYPAWDVPERDDFKVIAAGFHHGLGLKEDGSIEAWGRNYYGQCNVPSGNNFIKIAAGENHSLAIYSDGSLTAWGNNMFHQCEVPTGNDFVEVAGGYYHSLALKADGSIVAWGYNRYGECDVPAGNDFIKIDAGNYYSLALKSDGTIVAWGHDSRSDVPQGTGFIDVSAGPGHGLAIRGDGSIVQWGWLSEYYPAPVENDFIAVEAGYNHRVALKSDGSIIAWGANYNGQCNVPLGNNFASISSFGFHSMALTREPTTPPVADADGPYTINVGDMLTLDANGSTDADDDIVSYMWDLDDDGSFETDAGGQAVFDVDYAYLQSLGLLINYTYTIHLKVTDSEGQSDVNDSTLIIVPKPATVVAVDIKPGSCPNPLNVKSSGVLPVAVLGSADVNVLDIDPTSIAFSIGDVNVGVIRCGYEDVAAPVSDSNDCNCITEGSDGFLDLTLKFKTQRIVEAVGDVNDGDELQLELIGVLFDETPIEGADCILIRGRHKPINPADINKDGVVNTADFAIFAENWLQSSIED